MKLTAAEAEIAAIVQQRAGVYVEKINGKLCIKCEGIFNLIWIVDRRACRKSGAWRVAQMHKPLLPHWKPDITNRRFAATPTEAAGLAISELRGRGK